jgi:hypothetical protein
MNLRRSLFAAVATAAAKAAPSCGASSLAQASNSQITCGASQSPPIGRRALVILASDVFPDPHGPLIAMVSGVRTGLWVFWLVHLRLESGEDSWFEYVKLNIRPRERAGSDPHS